MFNNNFLLVNKNTTTNVTIISDSGQGGAIVFDKSSEQILQGETKTIELPIGEMITASYRDSVISGELFILVHSDNIFSNSTRIFRIDYPMEGTYLNFGDLY